MTRLVIDAGVLLSASVAATHTPLALLMGAVRSGAVEMVACDGLLAEVRRGLERPYFRERLTEEEREGIPAAFSRVAVNLADPADPPRAVRDPKDDYLVALAREAGAVAIVTGDRDLLDDAHLNPPAITPRAVCAQLGLLSGQGA